MVDLMMGGGRQHFLPEYRADQKNLVQIAKDKGYNVIQSKNELTALSGLKQE